MLTGGRLTAHMLGGRYLVKIWDQLQSVTELGAGTEVREPWRL
jgi:hypothetical protein